MASAAPLLPAFVQERASLEPLATVSILLALQPVVRRLQQAMEDLSSQEAEWLGSLLERTGSAVVFRGHPNTAHHIERRLRDAGLTTTVNLLAQT